MICRWIILNERGEAVLLVLFSPEWEGRGAGVGGGLAAVITATCEDYFTDLKRWLAPVFFGKLVQQLGTGGLCYSCIVTYVINLTVCDV